jgi:hypothetical protein
MATNNFHNVNANRIFAVLMGYEDSETNEFIEPSDYEYDDLISNLKSELKEKFGYVYNNETVDFLRSFSGSVIGGVSEEKTYMGVEVRVKLIAVIRSGYYQGANLDYEIEYSADGYENDEFDGVIDEWVYQANKYNNNGLVQANRSKVENWLENTKNEMIEKLEKIYSEYSDVKLVKVGQFSNGEAVYEKA